MPCPSTAEGTVANIMPIGAKLLIDETSEFQHLVGMYRMETEGIFVLNPATGPKTNSRRTLRSISPLLSMDVTPKNLFCIHRAF
jgi:hypothetical protein